MESESCSWVTRAKFSQKTYIRSCSSKWDYQSYRVCDLKKEFLSFESMPMASVSEAESLLCSFRKTDEKSGSKIEDSCPVSSDLVSSNESNSKKIEFSFHRSLSTAASDTIKLYSDYAYWFACSMNKLNQMERKSKPKKRSISPLPTTILSDEFKEAKSNSKQNFFNNSWSLQQYFSVKGIAKLGAKKEAPLLRYIDDGVWVEAVETIEKWFVNLSELYFGARFASGANSRLYHGVYKNKPVAVKVIRLPDDDEGGIMVARLERQFIREVTFLSHLCHRNVIKLAGACNKSPILFIITEYLSEGSLRALLRRLDHSPLPLARLISIALDVARGMEYIHSQGVIHRDLKSGNILFDGELCAKIADFGVACEEEGCGNVAGDDAGTYRWMAPEMIKNEAYGRKVDVYSFGMLLWEMLTGEIPYEDMTPIQAAFAVVNKNLRPVIRGNSPATLRVLIEQCWSTLPEKRPEFWQIVKVLEQFESELAKVGTINEQIQPLSSHCQDERKQLLAWIEKLSH